MKSKFFKLFFTCLIVAILFSISVNIFSTSAKKEVNLVCWSYDKKSSIDFGTVSSDSILNVDSEGLHAKVDDASSFVENRVLNQSFYYSTVYTEQGVACHILFNDGYAYRLYAQNNEIVCNNMVASFKYLFPFMTSVNIDDEETSCTLTYDELNSFNGDKFLESKFNSYEDIKSFYLNIDQLNWRADDENKTIYVKCYNKVNATLSQNRLSSGYPFKIECNDDGVTISIDKNQLNIVKVKVTLI